MRIRRDFLLEQFDAEMLLSGRTLLAVPESDLEWRPHPRSYSMGRLAMHVAAIPGWLPALVSGASYDMGAGGSGPPVPSSRQDILERHAVASASARALLTSLDEATLDAAWTLRRHGAVVETMTRAEAIARYVIRHVTHHRGQLTVYLRLVGAPVPALFGDSADCHLLPSDGTP